MEARISTTEHRQFGNKKDHRFYRLLHRGIGTAWGQILHWAACLLPDERHTPTYLLEVNQGVANSRWVKMQVAVVLYRRGVLPTSPPMSYMSPAHGDHPSDIAGPCSPTKPWDQAAKDWIAAYHSPQSWSPPMWHWDKSQLWLLRIAFRDSQRETFLPYSPTEMLMVSNIIFA